MKAKPRSEEAMPSSNGASRKFYLPNSVYDELIRESVEKDCSISQLVKEKLETYNKIKVMIK